MLVLDRLAAYAAPSAALLLISGCGTNLLPGTVGRAPTLTLSSLVEDESTFHESDANDLLDLAEYVAFAADPRIIRGTIDSPDDVDVFDLGPVETGDHIVVRMATDETLDGAIAAFDDTDSALLVNDHRNVYLGVRDPFIDIVARRPSDALYVAVAATPGYSANGDYGLVATRTTGAVPLAPQPDRVLLIFNGGDDVVVGGRPAVDVPVFDAATIDPNFTGRTEDIIRALVADVRDDFAGFDVEIYSTSEGAFDDGTMTRIYFGTFDAALLGVAEGVDEFNSRQHQTAIVFTDTFTAFGILRPNTTQMAQALANVASHEIGHLLGLVHTADRHGLMDVTASLRDLMENQSFRKSPIYRDVFPVGQQDAPRCLLDSLGGDEDFVLARQRAEASKAVSAKAGGPARRKQLLFSTCGLEEH